MPSIDQFYSQRRRAGGGTNGTLSTRGLYQNPTASHQGLGGTGITSAGDNMGYIRTVGDDGLVENRLNNLTAGDSAYINQARTGAQRYAAGRGLGNSAYAGAAGIEAAIRQAMPIAAADASAINQAQSENSGYMNAGLQQQRQLMNQATIAGAELEASERARRSAMSASAASDANSLRMQRERLGYEGEQQGLDRAHQYGMMGYEFGLRNEIADNDSFRTDWLSNQSFNREQYGAMTQMQRDMATMGYAAEIDSAMSFRNMFNQYALENPDVFNAQNYTNIGTFMTNQTTQMYSDLFARWGLGG